MRYCPESSVTADRIFSMSAGLDASTVTPGSTPPDESFTTPVMDAWAYADAGSTVKQANPSKNPLNTRISLSLKPSPRPKCVLFPTSNFSPRVYPQTASQPGKSVENRPDPIDRIYRSVW